MTVELPRHVRFDLGYQGRRFHGSQRQPGVRTVQGELEGALEQLTGHTAPVVFAGRTDSGVHAVGQVASGSVYWTRELERLRYGLDSVTEDDLTVYRLRDVPHEFHARFSARRREYRYRVWNARRAPLLMAESSWWVRDTLCLDRLNEAAAGLVGSLDFRSFTGKGFGTMESDRMTKRTVEACEWQDLRCEIEPAGRLLEMRIAADAFLPHMVRNIVGALILVGTGEWSRERLTALIERRERREAPPPAPARGLILWRVDYSDEQERVVEPADRVHLEQE